MATLPALIPNGDRTIATAVITRSSGAGTYFSHIDQDPTTGQPAAQYLYNAGAAGGDGHFDIGPTPSDFASMDTLQVQTYTAVIGRVDDNIEFRVGVFAADETTRLAGDSSGVQGEVVSGAANPAGLYTTTLTLTAAGLAADKATWDDAVIRLNWIYTQSMSKDSYDLRCHGVQVIGTYTAAVIPSTPTGLSATPVSESQIDVSWNASSGATGYDLDESGTIISANQAGTTFSDSGLLPGTSGTYKVRAKSSAGDSSYTATVNTTTPINAPTGLTVTPVSPTELYVEWDGRGVLDEYDVERNGVIVDTKLMPSEDGGLWSSSTGLAPSTTYDFRVRGRRGTVDGTWSSVVQGTTPSDNVLPTAAAVADPASVSDFLTPIELDGTTSTDSDGTIASYQWSLVSSPPGYTGTFDTPTASTTTFTPSAGGSLLDSADFYWDYSDLTAGDLVWVDRNASESMTLGKEAVLTGGSALPGLRIAAGYNGGVRNYAEIPTGSPALPNISMASGEYTILVAVKIGTQSTVPIWDMRTGGTAGPYMYLNTSTSSLHRVLYGGSNAGSARTWTSVTDAYRVMGWKYTAPIVRAYVSGLGVGVEADTTPLGEWSSSMATLARIGQYAYTLSSSLDAIIGAVVVFHQGLTLTEMDEVSTLLGATMT